MLPNDSEQVKKLVFDLDRDERLSLVARLIATAQVDELRKLFLAGVIEPNMELKGIPLLGHAVGVQSIELVTLLLEFEADPNKSTYNGLTPLHIAAAQTGAEACRILVKAGAEINAVTTGSFPDPFPVGSTALHIAADNDDLLVCKYLLELGADPNAKDSLGVTPLEIANGSEFELMSTLFANWQSI